MTPFAKWFLATLLVLAFGVPAVSDVLDELDRPADETFVRRSETLGGDIVLRWSESSRTLLALACVGARDRCVPAWLDPSVLFADRVMPWWQRGSCSLGCLYIRHEGAGWTCEPHPLYLPSVD